MAHILANATIPVTYYTGSSSAVRAVDLAPVFLLEARGETNLMMYSDSLLESYGQWVHVGTAQRQKESLLTTTLPKGPHRHVPTGALLLE